MRKTNELWEMPTDKSLRQSLAGFRANMNRILKQEMNEKRRTAITCEYNRKIENAIKSHYEDITATKLHNAAVKAVRTRRMASDNVVETARAWASPSNLRLKRTVVTVSNRRKV